jgi:hypothetical protein
MKMPINIRDPFTRKIDEFCEKGDLHKYRGFLITLFREIERKGCYISARDDVMVSSHSKSPDDCRIRISFKEKHKNSLHVIWTILHEFGHHFDPMRKEDENNIDIIIEQEEKAWKWAYDKMLTYSEFKGKEGSFLECEKAYLEKYYALRKD